MLVYSSEFPISLEKNRANVFDVFIKWVIGSPHYPFNSSDSIQKPSNEICETFKDGHSVSLAHIESNGCEYSGIRYHYCDVEGREWTTEVTAKKTKTENWVVAKIFCDLLNSAADVPQPKKPHIIKLLFNDLGGGDDGEIPTSDKPIFLADNQKDLQFATSIISGSVKCTLPIIFISVDFNGYPVFDAKTLAHWMSGMAHVVVEPNRRFSVKLAEKVGQKNCYGGTACIYWPDGNRRRKIFPDHYASINDAQSDIVNAIRESLVYAKNKIGATWLKVKELIADQKISQLKESGEKDLNKFILEFDEQNRNLKEQLSQANSQIQSLSQALQQMQLRSMQKGGISLNSGVKNEFYPGELTDAIISALKKSVVYLGEDTRHMNLITDVIGSNVISDSAQKIEKAIREALENYQKFTSKEKSALEKIGFSITEEGKHVKIIYQEDPRFTFVLAKTPSDHRAGKNNVSIITKKLLIF